MSKQQNMNFIVTPIARNYKKSLCSKRDWEEQEERKANGYQMMWDDSVDNKAQVGDILLVVKNEVSVTAHRITKVLDYKNRYATWSKNVGQTTRNVLYITPCLCGTIPWNIWKLAGYDHRIQATQTIKRESSKRIITELIASLTRIQDIREESGMD